MFKKIFLTTLLSILIFIILSFLNIYPFLATQKPIPNAKILVVDGWMNDSLFSEAVVKFKKGNYSLVLVPGSNMDRSLFFPGMKSVGEASSVVLMYKGIPPEKIVPVYFKKVAKDRTYQSALAIKNWLKTNKHQNVSLNLFTQSTHARRSWFLYKKAFNGEFNIGIIASQPDDYNPKRWWKTSNGVRSVIDESIAYLYAILFFHPDI
jgi:hypothetical protein